MIGRKRIIKGKEVREGLTAGADKIALAVCSTLGPFGKNVALERQYNPPHITKDGVTVARDIILEDPIENMAVQIIKEASSKTAKEAGDGTTTTVLLANELLKHGFPLVDQYGISKFTKGMNYIVDQLINELNNISTPITTDEQIFNVAMISSNGDEEISKLVADIFSKLGKDAQVLIKESNSYETKVEITKGIMFDKSFASMYFHKQDASKSLILDPKVLITDLNINTVKDVMTLEKIYNEVNAPLVVICGDISDIALECLVYAFKRGVQIYPIRGPFVAQAKEEALLDISIATGGKFLTMKEGYNLDNINSRMLGSALSVEVDYNRTIILPNRGSVDNDLFNNRVKYYQEKIMQDTEGLKPNYEKRLAMINAGTGVVYVGGSSEVDITERKDRLDDTICAVRGALKSGIVIGAGTTYLRLADHLFENANKEYTSLYHYMISALDKPALKIFENVHENSTLRIIDIHKVIEPAFVLEQVIRNSVKAAIMILSTDVAVIDVETEDKFNPVK